MNKNSRAIKNGIFRFFAWLQVFLQVLFPLVSLLPHSAIAQDLTSTSTSQSPFSIDRNANSTAKETPALPYGDTMSSVASALSSNGAGGVASSAKSAATGYASSSAQQWLSQFGTARVQLNVDDNGHWDDSAIDFLAPLYDNKKSMLLIQLGLRAPDGRITGNMGMGVRTFYVEDWMFGGNVFFDDDFTGKNRRIGIGAEAWTNNLKLSANTYVGTTEWHQSRDFNDYNEKPADGYDVRAEGYLPAYPQLGARLMYEQYYGDKVALFDTDHLQSNPSAVTTGLSYTPIPLVQLAVNYKRGQDSLDDTQFQANFRYDLGRPWAYQVDPGSVRLERSLAGSRYDLVERNNQIVLQYKKKDQQTVSNLSLQVTVDNSPSDGLTPNSAQVYATDKDGQPVRNAPIVWSTTGSAKFATPNAVTNDSGIAAVNFTNTVPEAVQITAKSGAASASQNSQFNAVTVSNITLKIIKDSSIADGKTPNHAVATVTDINNRPIANSQVTWGIDAAATLKSTQTTTNVSGQVTTDFTSTTAGAVMLTATAGDKSASQQGHFIANSASNVIDTMVVTKDGSAANGTTTNTVNITVKDGNGTPVSNANVSLSADKGTVIFGAALNAKAAKVAKTFQTDAQGSLTVAFTDTVAETIQLTATLENGNTRTATAHFVAVLVSARVSDMTVTTGAVANGTATNQATATVVDANNNPLPGMDVTWTQDGAAVFSTSAKTDANGQTTVKFTDTKAQTVNVIATLTSGSTLSRPSTFVADSTSARVSDLTVTTGAAANGTATNQATVTVVDANNNPLPGMDVTWTQDGTAVLGTSAKTNTSGQTIVTFTDTKVETVNVTATVNNSSLSKPSTFVADTASAEVVLNVRSPAFSDGSASVQVNATVKDKSGNILPNFTLNWSVTDPYSNISATQSRTDVNGNAVVSVTNASYIDKDVTITATSSAANATVGAHFNSPLQGGKIVFVPFSGGSPISSITADGAIYAHVVFSSLSASLPLDKIHSGLQGTSSSGATIDNYAQTSDNKVYEAHISNVTKSGEIQATFQIGEYSLISSQLNILPSSILESASHLELSQSSIPQGSSVVVTLIAFDKYGNPDAISGNGSGVLLKLSKTIGINAPQAFTLMPDGSYQATIQTTLDAQVGALTISADPNGVGGGFISTSATITSNPVNAVATVSPRSGQCMIGTPCRMSVKVKNITTGEVMPFVTLKVKEVTMTGAIISPDTVTSDGNGSDSTIYITSNVSGPIRIIAEINGSVEPQPETEIIFSP